MNINSQFSINTYTGRNSLNLMSINNNPTITGIKDIADYNRFIEAVSTIYATQNTTGGIPVFWTTRNTSVDSAGNTRYVYIPNTESTLTTLESNKPYYFIIRDSSYIPLRIPMPGGDSTQDNTDTASPIKVTANVNANFAMTNGDNSQFFTINFGGLIPNELYKYTIESVNTNWPTIINPQSGILNSATNTISVDSQIMFCTSTGICPNGTPNLLPYTWDLDKACCYQNIVSNPIFSTLQIKIEPVSFTQDSISTSHFTFKCLDCLPLPNVTISEPAGISVILSGSGNYQQKIVASFDNLIKNQTYTYEFRGTGGNWPAVLTSTTGSFIANKSSVSVENLLSFCPSTAICPSGTPGLLPYSINAYKHLFDADNGDYTSVEVKLDSDTALMEPIISDKLTVYCKKCHGSIAVPKLTLDIKSDN